MPPVLQPLRLFRAILRAHKALPPVYRDLGDQYVRDEFRRHRTAKADFLKQFFVEWNGYLDALRAQASSDAPALGAHLSDEQQRAFNADQKQQLSKLREETKRAQAKLVADMDAQSSPLDAVNK
jgi:hypothetical protein